MSYRGDIRLGDTIDIKFTTRQASGAPTTLAGTPVISAYVGNSITQITAGITLTVDFDGVTGLNNVRVVATSGNGYATASNYDLVITTGTVNSVSVVGEVIGSFSVEARSGLTPTTADRLELFTDSWHTATAQAGAAGSITFEAGASAVTDFYKGGWIIITSGTGSGQGRKATASNGTTKVVSVSPDWATTPDNTSVYLYIPEGLSIVDSTNPIAADVRQINGTTVLGAGTSGNLWRA